MALIGTSFAINNGPPPSASDADLLAFGVAHRNAVLWGAWMQAVGPALIVAFALTLVNLSGAASRIDSVLTLFGCGVLMMTSLTEVVCYIAALYPNPANMARIATNFGHAVQHLYFFIAAPALFLPLGLVLLSSRVLPRVFAWAALALGLSFLVLGVTSLELLVLPDPITAFAAVQALWWLFAAITLILRPVRTAAAAG